MIIGGFSIRGMNGFCTNGRVPFFDLVIIKLSYLNVVAFYFVFVLVAAMVVVVVVVIHYLRSLFLNVSARC